jgi:predicted aspartyl protease
MTAIFQRFGARAAAGKIAARATHLLCVLGCAWLLARENPLRAAQYFSDGAPEFTQLEKPVVVPAELADHVMFVSAMINGQGPFRVMVDTGCSLTVLSPQLAMAVGAVRVSPEESLAVALNGLGNPTEVERVALASIELDGVRFEGVPAVVSDTFDEISAVDGRRVDAILGFPLFRDLFLGLDFPNHRMLLSREWPASVPKVRASLPVIEQAGVPFISAQVQGRTVRLLIDTGANQALHLSPDVAAPLDWKVPPRAGPLVAVFGEVGREGIGRLAGNLTLDGVRHLEPTAVISDGPPSLGVRSLEKFCVVFNQAQRRVWLCRADDTPIAPTAERSIGLSFLADRDGWRIAGVIPGSPAETARLAAGAVVTRLEGRSAASWTRDQIQRWIDTHPQIELTVADEAGERAVSLPVWTIVP